MTDPTPDTVPNCGDHAGDWRPWCDECHVLAREALDAARAEVAELTALNESQSADRHAAYEREIDAVMRAEKAEAEVARLRVECDKFENLALNGWPSDWRERAEKAEAEVARRLTAERDELLQGRPSVGDIYIELGHRRRENARLRRTIEAVEALCRNVEADDPRTIKAVHVSRIRAALEGEAAPPAEVCTCDSSCGGIDQCWCDQNCPVCLPQRAAPPPATQTHEFVPGPIVRHGESRHCAASVDGGYCWLLPGDPIHQLADDTGSER